MRPNLPSVLFSLLAFAVFVDFVHAEEGFQFPDLNPFKTASTPAEIPSDNPSRPFSLPKLPSAPALPKPTLPKLSLPKLEMPSFGNTSRAPTPSPLEKLNRGTKSLLTKTRSVLMPWSEPSTEGQRVAQQPKRSSFFPSWLGTRKEADEVDSVNAYLALPRPSP